MVVVGGNVGSAAGHAPHPGLVDAALPRVIAAGAAADAQRLGTVVQRGGVGLAGDQRAVDIQLERAAVIGAGHMRPGVGRQVGADLVVVVVVDEEVDASVGVVGQPVAVTPAAVAAFHQHAAVVGHCGVAVDPGLYCQRRGLQAGAVGHGDETRRAVGGIGQVGLARRVTQRGARSDA